MLHATSRPSLLRQAGHALFHFAHGGLLVAGLLVLALLAVRYAQHGQLSLLPPQPVAETVARLPEPENDYTLVSLDNLSSQSLSPGMRRVKEYLARRYRVSEAGLEPLLLIAQQAGRSVGLDPMLLIAVMAVESSFNPLAESPMGAQGLMQVIPRFHTDKFEPDDSTLALLDPATNIRVGALVLKEAIQRAGTLEGGLRRYGGVVQGEQPYARRVIAEKQRLADVAKRGPGRGSA